jgi:hypothetical protein
LTHDKTLTQLAGSPSDPASLGTATLLLSTHDQSYFEAAKRQAEYLITKATRYRVNATHSAMSHRDAPPELWGDFVYMVPPFLAYYGVATQDMRYLEESVGQCQLYDEVLRTDIPPRLDDGQQTCRGRLWRHIVSDPAILEPEICCTDPDLWLTSNAWAVAGMTRVLTTILKWQPPDDSPISPSRFAQFVGESRTVLVEIISAMLNCVAVAAHQLETQDQTTGLLKNYLFDVPAAHHHQSADRAFGDTAGTALMVSAVYRLAVLLPDTFARPLFLDWAHAKCRAVSKHIDLNGVAGPVADVSHVPSQVPVPQSSEGQSMVILMYSALRDCMDAGICRGSSPYWLRLWTWATTFWSLTFRQ